MENNLYEFKKDYQHLKNLVHKLLGESDGDLNPDNISLDDLFLVEKDANGNIIKTVSIYDLQVPPQSIEIGESIKASDLAQVIGYSTKYNHKQYLLVGYEFNEDGSKRPFVKDFGEPTSFVLQPVDSVTKVFSNEASFNILSQQDVIGELYTLKIYSDNDIRLRVSRYAENGGEKTLLVDEVISQEDLSLDGSPLVLTPVVDFETNKLYELNFTSTSDITIRGLEFPSGTYTSEGVGKVDGFTFVPYVERTKGWEYTQKELAFREDIFEAVDMNPVENEYPDIPTMLGDQTKQTTGFFQYVEDDGEGEEAYYEKLDTSNGVIEDYRKLDSGEVVLLNNNNSFKTFKISNIETTPISAVGGGKIGVQYNPANDNVYAFTFNKRYSKIIENIVSLFGDFKYVLKVYNQNKRKYHLGKVSTFYTWGDYVNVVVQGTMDFSNNFEIGNKLQIEFDIDNEDNGGGGVEDLANGNASVEFSHYSFSTGQDSVGFYNDGNIQLSWDAPGNDLELVMLTEPAGTGDLVALSTKGNSPVNTEYITQPNLKYDIYPTGVNATEGLIAWISAELDPAYPSYKIYLHNAGSSYNSNVEVKKIIPNP